MCASRCCDTVSATVDWIEELLGISPDAGTGLTEMLFALVAVLTLVAIAVRVAAWRRPAR